MSTLTPSSSSAQFDKLRYSNEEEKQRFDHDEKYAAQEGGIGGTAGAGGTVGEGETNGTSVRELERLRIRKKYEQRMHERKVMMYKKALEEAVLREKAAAQKSLGFCIQYPTTFGQNMFMVGNDISLGCWNTENATPMLWTDGNVWKCTITPSPDTNILEYKYILKQGDSVDWEYGKNHRLDLTDRKVFRNTKMDVWGVGN